MSAIQAARAAAELRKEPGIEVTTVPGRYGELSVLVDGERVLSAGPWAFLGILPSVGKIRNAVVERVDARVGLGEP